MCCSQWGYCGLGSEFCGNGCQSGACCPEKRCGKQAGGDKCPNNFCCSAGGYCGLGGNYCGSGCQSGGCYKGGDGMAAILANNQSVSFEGIIESVAELV
jgi:hypothetical protein